MSKSLKLRQEEYERASDFTLLPRAPVIIRAEGRSFKRLCKNLQKPYEPILLEALVETMYAVVSDMVGAVFAYCAGDNFVFVLRNDQKIDSEPWYNNRIQDIVSITSGLITNSFKECLDHSEKKLDLNGPALFRVKTFVVPSLSEVINNLLCQQQINYNTVATESAQVLLGRKFGRRAALKMLEKQTIQEKILIMNDECGIDFDQEFPSAYRLGVGAYKVPTVITLKNEKITRNKWTIDWDIPDFISGREFFYNILVTGHDVFREKNLLSE